MSQNSSFQTSKAWVERASEFVNEGFAVVPINPLGGLSRDEDDPVIKHLGHQTLVNRVTGGASTQSEVEKLGRFLDEEAPQFAAVTGEEWDLLAIQIKKVQGTEDNPFWQQIRSLTDGFPGIASNSQEYILLPHPNVEKLLPAVTEKKKTVLHGEDSLIHLPGGVYEWKERFFNSNGEHVKRDERRKRAREIIELYGLEDYLGPEEEPEEETTLQEKGSNAPSRDGAGQLGLPLNGEPSYTNGQEPDPLFRSGDDLKRSAERANGRLNLPWTVPGGLSVLTGPPKIAGKSSWVLNLALHLSAGEPFLGFENTPSDVVLLADTSPANLREVLAQANFVDRERTLSRLQVLHPSDVADYNWASTLRRVYGHVRAIGADLLIIDCLDRYIRLKGDVRPTESKSVIHKLTAGGPADCPVLGVKSTDCSAGESMSVTIDRLGMLGTVADAILRLDDISTDTFPCLRRLSTVSRRGSISQSHFCSLRSGRYVRVRRSDLAGLATENGLSTSAPSESFTRRGKGAGPLLPS